MRSSATYVDGRDSMVGLARKLGAAAEVAVDCEAAGYHRYSDQICLVQLATASEAFVVDVLAAGPAEEAGPVLGPILGDPGRRVLMHGGSYDVRLLRRDLGVTVGHVFDTQVAASFLGEPATGLQALLEKHLGVALGKKHQRADWARRPLTDEMIAYAAADVRHLRRLAAIFEEQLAKLGRTSWAEEECARMLLVASEPAAEAEVDPVSRIRAAKKLSPREVTALRRAVAWRDRVARTRDRAPFRVATDAALIEAVLASPTTVPELRRVRGFPRRGSPSEARALLRELAAARRLPERSLEPYPAPTGRGRRLTPEEKAVLARLSAVRNEAATRLGLERGRVMPNHTLRALALLAPTSLSELREVPELRRWQVALLGRELLAAL